MQFRNDSKFEKTVRWVYYLISGLLCLFLILLSGRILDDLGSSVAYPELTDFENKTLLDSLARRQDSLNVRMSAYEAKSEQLTKASQLAKENYEQAKSSFDNWLEARKVLGEPSKDRELIDRTVALDQHYKIQQEWNAVYAALQDTLEDFREESAVFDQAAYAERDRAGVLFQKAVLGYELRVFLIRLAFIFPVLFLGIFFYVKRRNHRYWPLYMGFTWFSLYAFFFGLVPYLPSYGGYVRYTVGILLSAIGGYYAINNIRAYLEKRKEELQKPTEERSRQVESDTAFKAYEQHLCPSCGKDFIFKDWTLARQSATDAGIAVSHFCRQCGFELYKKCPQCSELRFAHLPFCGHCGAGKG